MVYESPWVIPTEIGRTLRTIQLNLSTILKGLIAFGKNSQGKQVLKKTVKNHKRFSYCPPQPVRKEREG